MLHILITFIKEMSTLLKDCIVWLYSFIRPHVHIILEPGIKKLKPTFNTMQSYYRAFRIRIKEGYKALQLNITQLIKFLKEKYTILENHSIFGKIVGFIVKSFKWIFYQLDEIRYDIWNARGAPEALFNEWVADTSYFRETWENRIKKFKKFLIIFPSALRNLPDTLNKKYNELRNYPQNAYERYSKYFSINFIVTYSVEKLKEKYAEISFRVTSFFSKYWNYTYYDWKNFFFKRENSLADFIKEKEKKREQDKNKTDAEIILSEGEESSVEKPQVGLIYKIGGFIFDGLLWSGLTYLFFYRFSWIFFDNHFLLHYYARGRMFDSHIPVSPNVLGYMYAWQMFLIDCKIYWTEETPDSGFYFYKNGKLRVPEDAPDYVNYLMGPEYIWERRMFKRWGKYMQRWYNKWNRYIGFRLNFRRRQWFDDALYPGQISDFLNYKSYTIPTFFDNYTLLNARSGYMMQQYYIIPHPDQLPYYFWSNMYLSLLTLNPEWVMKVWNKKIARRLVTFMYTWTFKSAALYKFFSLPLFIYYSLCTQFIGTQIFSFSLKFVTLTLYSNIIGFVKFLGNNYLQFGMHRFHSEHWIEVPYTEEITTFLRKFEDSKIRNWLHYFFSVYFLSLSLVLAWGAFFLDYLGTFVYLISVTFISYTYYILFPFFHLVIHGATAYIKFLFMFWTIVEADFYQTFMISYHFSLRVTAVIFVCYFVRYFIITGFKLIFKTFLEIVFNLIIIIFSLANLSIRDFFRSFIFFIKNLRFHIVREGYKIRIEQSRFWLRVSREVLDKKKLDFGRINLYEWFRYVTGMHRGTNGRYYMENKFQLGSYLPRFVLLIFGSIVFIFGGGAYVLMYIIKFFTLLLIGDTYMRTRSLASGVANGMLVRAVSANDYLIYKFNIDAILHERYPETFKYWHVKYWHGARKIKSRFMLGYEFRDRRFEMYRFKILPVWSKKHREVMNLWMKHPVAIHKWGIFTRRKMAHSIYDYYSGYRPIVKRTLVWRYDQMPHIAQKVGLSYMNNSHLMADLISGFIIPLVFGYFLLFIWAAFSGLIMYTNDTKYMQRYGFFLTLLLMPFLAWLGLWFPEYDLDDFFDFTFGYGYCYFRLILDGYWYFTDSSGFLEDAHHLTEYQKVMLLVC